MTRNLQTSKKIKSLYWYGIRAKMKKVFGYIFIIIGIVIGLSYFKEDTIGSLIITGILVVIGIFLIIWGNGDLMDYEYQLKKGDYLK